MMLRTDNLVVHYGAVRALNDASIYVDEGEIVAIIGGNGSGKSTLLKAVAGMLNPTHGNIEFLGNANPGLACRKSDQAWAGHGSRQSYRFSGFICLHEP